MTRAVIYLLRGQPRAALRANHFWPAVVVVLSMSMRSDRRRRAPVAQSSGATQRRSSCVRTGCATL
jgi:hypothetical protein